MSVEDDFPDWVSAIFSTIISGIEFKSEAFMEARYSPADDNSLGVDLLTLAPALMDLSETGSGDAADYGIIHNLDLLNAQTALNEVISLQFGINDDGKDFIAIEGKIGDKDLVVLIYSEPYEDAEVEDFSENGVIREVPSDLDS
jgi:hypothetical protein